MLTQVSKRRKINNGTFMRTVFTPHHWPPLQYVVKNKIKRRLEHFRVLTVSPPSDKVKRPEMPDPPASLIYRTHLSLFLVNE